MSLRDASECVCVGIIIVAAVSFGWCLAAVIQIVVRIIDEDMQKKMDAEYMPKLYIPGTVIGATTMFVMHC